MAQARWVAFLLAVAAAFGAGLYARRPRAAPKPPELSETLVLERIRRVAKLATIEYGMADIISFNQEMPWYAPDKQVVVIADGVVLAGVDLQDGTTCRVTGSGTNRTVALSLPAAKILSVDVNFRYFLDKGGLTPEDRTWILTRGKRAIREKAVRTGVLKKAEQNAASVLASLVEALDPQATVRVAVQSAPDTPLPERAMRPEDSR